MAYWGTEDAAACDLLDRARGFINDRRDFIFVVINKGSTTSALTTSLRDHIRRVANDGEDGKNFIVLETEGKDPEHVNKKLLRPILEHLSTRLPQMDAEIKHGTYGNLVGLVAKIERALSDLDAVLGSIRSRGGSSDTEVYRRAEELQKDLATDLSDIVFGLKEDARSDEEDPVYLDTIFAARNSIIAWADDSFGLGKEAWTTEAVRCMKKDAASQKFAVDQLNSIRVEISHRFCELDNYFHAKVDELLNRVGGVLLARTGQLLTEADPLGKLSKLLVDASEPCPGIQKAVDELRCLGIEYRTHLHPRVRQQLDRLSATVDNSTDTSHVQINVTVDESGARILLRELQQLAKQAASSAANTLIEEAKLPALVLHAAVEQFDDATIRSNSSDNEFRQIGRSYRHEIWPNVFEGLDESNAKYARVRNESKNIQEQLKQLQREEVGS